MPDLSVPIIDPQTNLAVDDISSFTVRDIPRFCAPENYTDSFGFQWNHFAETQLKRASTDSSFNAQRLFAETGWQPADLTGLNILEAGSGAGRFSRVILQDTKAELYSFDFSNAVDANWANNGSVAPERFRLFQASIYEMPFPDNSFDRTFCLGVLQHTPSFEQSVRCLIAKTKIGGEIVVDFYEVRRWWTKLNAKYLLRPFTKHMKHERLLALIERHADRLISIYRFLDGAGLRVLTRFVPICDLKGTLPPGLTSEEIREWSILDTFDMFSPEFDNPQRIRRVAAMFERHGATVSFAGQIDNGTGLAAVIRAVKRP